jgi:hypothetical protein
MRRTLPEIVTASTPARASVRYSGVNRRSSSGDKREARARDHPEQHQPSGNRADGDRVAISW